jgi:hypothetical protein
MSDQQTQQQEDPLYNSYFAALTRFSKCIYPVASAALERQDNYYEIQASIDLENYCIFERKEVSQLRDQLIQRKLF